MRILMIHGRAQGGKDPESLKSIWLDTLKKGFKAAGAPFPEGLQVDFPFYGDKLDYFTEQARLPSPSDLVAKGPGQDREFEQFMQSALGEMKSRAEIPDEEVVGELDERGVQEKGIQNWGWVLAIARVIDRHLTGASEFTIETFLKDVFLYLSKPAVTRGINRIVQEKLTGEPTIVIGHSLGSVVGYKIILENLQSLNLVKYITVGSPLGLKAISSRLAPLQNSCGAGGWYNAYDLRDIVALNPLDDNHFPTDPTILNHGGVDNQTDNRHGIVGYLNDASVARQIAQALG
ncbi:MAG: hypothetical protein R2940_07705 [Syntrophotaleaceae bacterium]